MSNIEQSIKKKIEDKGTPLSEWDITINYGIKTGFNDAFIITTEKRNELLSLCESSEERERTAAIIRPVLRGRDIQKNKTNWENLWLINTHNGVKGQIDRIDINEYPSIKHHLDKYWDHIFNRADQGDTPYNLRNCAYLEDFDKPKIIYPDISRKLSFARSQKKEILTNTAYFFHCNNQDMLEYLLRVLNSKLIDWYYRSLSVQLGEGAVRMFSIYVLRLPILKGDFSSIIRCKTEDEIDKEVYDMYGLSSDEIAFINSF